MIGNDGGGFGVSFLPGGDQLYKRPEEAQGPLGRAPLQEAIRILSLRVPRVVGANPLAPLALLGSQGGAGLQPGQLATLMRTLGVQPDLQLGDAGGGMGPTVGGAPGPTAPGSSLMPTGQGGGGPVGGLVNVSAGSTEPTQPTMPGRPGGDDGAKLYELARRQRESMGRISY